MIGTSKPQFTYINKVKSPQTGTAVKWLSRIYRFSYMAMQINTAGVSSRSIAKWFEKLYEYGYDCLFMMVRHSNHTDRGILKAA